MTAPIRAVRLVDGDSYSVQLTFDPATVCVCLTSNAVTVDLTPAEAATLGYDLGDAAEAPDRCGRCDSFAILAVEFEPLCDRCSRNLDAIEATS